jgi:PAS domain S-box-containing protein
VVAARDTGRTHEAELRSPDGRYWFIRGVPIKNEAGAVAGIVEFCLDITERRRAEGALRLTQFSIDRSADAAFWMGADARLVYVNDAACHSLGYSREELLCMKVHDIDPGFPAEVWPDHWRELQEHGAFIVESHHRTKDGREFPVEVRVNLIEFEGLQYNCAFARDISERKRAEEQRKQLEAEVRHAEKLKSLGVLAGGIAHDFNNLLVGVQGNAGLALETLPPGSPARELLYRIERAARRAADLTNQLLAYSGKGKFVVERVHLASLIEEMAHLLRASISKKVELKRELNRDLPPVEADVTQLRQVIMNLVINGSEAIGDACGSIRVRTGMDAAEQDGIGAADSAESPAQDPFVFIEVTDTGCGMDEGTRTKMFDPFFTTKFTGRGLGLAAVLGIVRSHGGTIHVDTALGRGTTIRVLFPIVKNCLRIPSEAQAPPPALPRRGTVLVADDEPDVLEVAEMCLDRLGLSVLTARDGRQAVDVFRAHVDEIDAVLLDLTMPCLSGEEAFSEMRRMRPDVRVILSSGYDEQDATTRFHSQDLAGFIQKPYRIGDLKAKLREVIGI